MINQFAGLLLLGALAVPAMAQQCAVTVESTDSMQFNTATIEVSKKCKEFTITLKHTGKLPKAAMGHNLVVTKASDMAAAGADAAGAGLANDYVKPKDERILAQTKMIGGGETSVAKINVTGLLAKESYAFFCTYPGHSALMKGTLKVTG